MPGSSCHLNYSTPAKPASHTTNNWTTCETCHKSTTAWTFSHSGITSNCSLCHAGNYPAAHNTYKTRFSTICENCHTYPLWTSATFNHSFTSFPTRHKGFSACSDCHSSKNYGNKGGCIECHTREGAKVHNTNQNSGCLSCHPRG
jgi:uncharacterized paraquat-inducible protein A